MGKIVFVDADNNTALVEKEDLEKFRNAIEDFSVFLPQRKTEILKTIEGLSDEELESFNVQNVFNFEV